MVKRWIIRYKFGVSKLGHVIIWAVISIILGFLLTKGTVLLYNEHRKNSDGMIEINLPFNSRLTYARETKIGTLYTRTSDFNESEEPKSYIYSEHGSNNIFIIKESKNMPKAINNK